MGKTLKRIILGTLLGTSLLSAGGSIKNNTYNQGVKTSSGIEKVIDKMIPKEESSFHKKLSQEYKEDAETKYGKDGGLWGLYYKITDKGYALYGIDPETNQEYYINIEQYSPRYPTAKKYVIYTVLKDNNGDKVLVKLHEDLIAKTTAEINNYETHDSLVIYGNRKRDVISGIYYMKKNEQSALNCDYAFRFVYPDDNEFKNISINPAELVIFSETQEYAIINYANGKIMKGKKELSDVDPKWLEEFNILYCYK